MSIDIHSCHAEAAAGRWRVAWLVHNDGLEPISLEEAWIPHGRFRGDGHLSLSDEIGPGLSSRLEVSVYASEPPNTIVENAFLILILILRARQGEQVWRIFARMRIDFDALGQPVPTVVSVTTQSLQ